MIQRSDYEEKVFKRIRFRWIKSWIFFLFFIAMILLLFVKFGNFFQIPKEISEYLLYTQFWNFSINEIEELSMTYKSQYTSFVYTSVYWISLLSMALLPLFFILDHFKRKRVNKCDLVFTKILILKKNVNNFLLHPNSKIAKKRFEKSLYDFDIDGYLSPIKTSWYRKPLYQWFELSSVDSDIKKIVFMMNDFHHIILFSVFKRYEVKRIQEAIDLLETMLYKLSISCDKELGIKIKINQKSDLLRVVKVLHPIQMELHRRVNSFNNETKDVSKSAIFNSFITIGKNVTAISIPAAVIMILGVYIFKIDFTQAFLTWFTVTFGAFAISLGFTKVNIQNKN